MIGGLPPPAGAGPNLADTMNSRCVIGSSPILREPTGVLSVLTDVVVVRVVLMDDRQRAVGIRSKRVACRRVVSCAINSFADGNNRYHLPTRIVGDSHYSTAASAEQTVMDCVNRHWDGLPARSGGPATSYSRGLRVDFDDLAGVSEVRIKLPIACGYAVFRFST